MIVPSGYTEADVLRTLDKVASVLSHKYSFGSFTPADTAQQARLFGLEALAKYDPDRPLENFLMVHCKNRLFNVKRDQHWRCESPCKRCIDGDYCTGTDVPCKRFANWNSRNRAKASLSNTGAGGLSPEAFIENDPSENAAVAELLAKVDRELDEELRADWQRMREGEEVPKRIRARLEAEIKMILGADLPREAGGRGLS